MFIFKVTGPSPLRGEIGVRQKGGLPGPPPRIPGCPGGLHRLGGSVHGPWVCNAEVCESPVHAPLPASIMALASAEMEHPIAIGTAQAHLSIADPGTVNRASESV